MTAVPRPSLASTEAPYADLTPDVVLDALESVGLRGDGRLLQLNSYENRVFQVFLEDGRVVVAKFYRPHRWTDAQILEEHQFAVELHDAEIPVVPPLLLKSDATTSTLICFSTQSSHYRFAVSERHAGRAPELEEAETRERLGRFIGRLHAVGARSRFSQRVTLTPRSHGREPHQFLTESGLLPATQAASWRDVVDRLLAAIERKFEAVGDINAIRLHGDCHLGNVLWTEAGPHFVDLDDAMNGPAVQDLWMLLSGEPQSAQRELADILAGYEDFMPFDRRQLQLIEALRSLRMIHYSAWLARRWADPAFPAAFPWFGTAAYWADQTERLREQLQLVEPEPNAPVDAFED